jgi:2-polyprenyl-3-methyl-5-hydroxy-6-metoxy-1,4-benzoquinol methylase
MKECPVCFRSTVSNAFRGSADYLQCGTCGLLWRSKGVKREDLNRVFSDPDWILCHASEDPRRGSYFRFQLARIHQVIAPPGKFLEAGCGTGEFLRIAREAGWDVKGIELSPGLCRIARGKVGDDTVHEGAVESAEFPSGSFDCIIALDLVEHIPEPLEPLHRFYTWLRPGGILVVQTPNAGSLRRYLTGRGWNLLAPDRHVLFHTPDSLCLALQATGFDPLSVTTISGRSTDRGLLRTAVRVYGSALARFRLGNGLWCAARRREER